MFRLRQYFATASLIGFAIVAVLLSFFYRRTSVDILLDQGERSNVALTQAFANTLWPDFSDFVAEAGELDIEEIAEQPQIDALDAAVAAQAEGLDVIKVTVYSLDELVVYSTDRADIGEDASENDDYLSAIDGVVSSELDSEDTVSIFDETLTDREVIESYVPVYGADGEIEGVFEVYDDVTPLLQEINQTQIFVTLVVVAVLAVLWLALYLIVQRAQGIMEEQRSNILRSEAELAAVVNTVEESLLGVRPDGSIATHNNSALKLWGYTDAEFDKLSVFDLFPKDERAGLKEALKHLTSQVGAAAHSDLQAKRADGSTFPVAVNLSQATVDDTPLITLAAQDTIALAEAQEALNVQNRKLARVNTFTQLTVEHTIDMIGRGAPMAEIKAYMEQATEQLQAMEEATATTTQTNFGTN